MATRTMSETDSPYKACPHCKEQIRAEAVKCRFCGEWLEQPGTPAKGKEPPKREEKENCGICSGTLGTKAKEIYGYPVCRRCGTGFANRRRLAFLVDYSLVWFLIPVALTVIVGIRPATTEGLRYVLSTGLFAIFSFSIMDAAFGDFGGAIQLMTLALLIYWLIKDGIDGRSLGKRLFGLRVVDPNTGVPAKYQASFKRTLPFFCLSLLYWSHSKSVAAVDSETRGPILASFGRRTRLGFWLVSLTSAFLQPTAAGSNKQPSWK